MVLGAKGAAGEAEGPAGRLMGPTRRGNEKAGDDKYAADVCVCVFEEGRKEEEHGPESPSGLDDSFTVLTHS